MPYRSGVFQAGLGAVCALAFVISNSFGGDSKFKRLVGTIQRTGEEKFLLIGDDARRHELQTVESVRVFLNEKEISFSAVENGHKAEVRYMKQKGQLIATHIEIFPRYTDFEPKT